MTKIIKVDPTWNPVENQSLEVGDVIDITDPKTLLDSGAAQLWVEPTPIVTPEPEPTVEVKSTKKKK